MGSRIKARERWWMGWVARRGDGRRAGASPSIPPSTLALNPDPTNLTRSCGTLAPSWMPSTRAPWTPPPPRRRPSLACTRPPSARACRPPCWTPRRRGRTRPSLTRRCATWARSMRCGMVGVGGWDFLLLLFKARSRPGRTGCGARRAHPTHTPPRPRPLITTTPTGGCRCRRRCPTRPPTTSRRRRDHTTSTTQCDRVGGATDCYSPVKLYV